MEKRRTLLSNFLTILQLEAEKMEIIEQPLYNNTYNQHWIHCYEYATGTTMVLLYIMFFFSVNNYYHKLYFTSKGAEPQVT